MTKRKYPLAPGWRKIITPPGIEMEGVCSNCGEHFRVTSAQKLIGGKEDARVLTECSCTVGMYKPNKEERCAILRRYRVRLVT
jgi:hypothetical protein